MLTVQNKSFEGVTLTGSYYMASDAVLNDDAAMYWADVQFALSGFNIGLQGGGVSLDAGNTDDTTAFGAKVGTTLSMFDVSLAYSTVDDGTARIENYGTGVKTPLYTQMILNQNFIKHNSDTFVARASMDALGGTFGIAFDYSELNDAPAAFNNNDGDYTEFDLTYKTKVFNDSTTLFAGYVYQELDVDTYVDGIEIDPSFDQNFLRFWARYNF
jgi:hypothetical protein